MNGKRIKGRLYLILALCMALLFTGCGGGTADGNVQPSFRETEAGAEERITQDSARTETEESEAEKPTGEDSAETQTDTDTVEPAGTEENAVTADIPIEGNYYYDLENVVLYLYLYDELPPNYITKNEAEALGWSGGSVERYQDGAAIGGDRFGNREGLLPTANGRKYIECDIGTLGASSRGAKRLVFSNDGLYFYTDDHYESFDEVIVKEDYTVEVLR